jgi:membrane protein
MRKILYLLQVSIEIFSQSKGTLMAGALAYYALFSISPLLVLTISIATKFLGASQMMNVLMERLTTLVGPMVAGSVMLLLDSYVRNAYSTFPAIISIGIMFFGASIVFVQLKSALNQIWGIAPKPQRGLFLFLRTQGLAFASVMVLGLILVSLTTASTMINSIRQFLFDEESLINQTLPFWDLLFSILLFSLIFSLLFKILPDADVNWRDVWLGGLVTSVAFTIGESLVGIYLSSSGILSLYGIAGSVIAIMIWVFYSAQILLFGAAFTKAYADLHGSHIRPSGASLLVDTNHYTFAGQKKNNQTDPDH